MPIPTDCFRWVALGDVATASTAPEIPDLVRAAADYAARFPAAAEGGREPSSLGGPSAATS